VDIGAEAALFPEKEYINGIVVAVWSGFIKLFPTRESLVSDIPAGDGKISNHFLQCTVLSSC
jgi:hypothetical protein